MENNPHLGDIICEYVNERMPQYRLATGTYSPGGSIFLEVFLPIFYNYGGWHMAIAAGDKYYMSLNNGKFIWLDVYAPDSLDVIYRLIRLSIAKRLKEQHHFIQSRLEMKNRKQYIAWCKRSL